MAGLARTLREETLATLEAEAAALEAYLAGLSETDLERPSACSEWTVAEVIGHITWGGHYFAEIVERARQGDTRPPGDLPPPGPARRQAIAARAKQTRVEAGAAIRAAFHEANEALAACLARVGPADWDRPTMHRLGPIRLVAQGRVNELAVHGWDIRSVIDPPGHLNAPSLPLLLGLLERWVELLAQPDPRQEATYRLRFDFTEPGFEPRDLVVAPSAVRFGPASGESADLVLRCHPEVPMLLAMGRLDPATAAASYGMRLSGNEALVELLRSRFGAF